MKQIVLNSLKMNERKCKKWKMKREYMQNFYFQIYNSMVWYYSEEFNLKKIIAIPHYLCDLSQTVFSFQSHKWFKIKEK